MNQLAVYVFWGLAAFSLYHFFWTVLLIWMVRQPARKSLTSPKTAVLLTLRGADPALPSTVRCLLDQTYGDFELFIAVDSWDDPAWQAIRPVIQEKQRHNLHVCELTRRLKTCSLKCSALVQMMTQLDESFEIVALADADLEPNPQWLTELVAPFDDSSVGVTSGYRWFTPPDGNLASVVRQMWNAVTIVPMIVCKIPWGGSMAFRASPSMRHRIIDRWSCSAVDDVIFRQVMKAVGLRIQPIPRLMMPIREECDMAFVKQFVPRQLLWVFTYLRRTAAIVFVYSLLLVTLMLTGVGTGLVALARCEWSAAAGALGGIALFCVVMFGLLLLVESTVRSSCRSRGDTIPKLPAMAILRAPIALPLTGLVHVWGVLVAQFSRSVQWRGVRYVIRGPWNVRLVEDLPSQVDAARSLANTSI